MRWRSGRAALTLYGGPRDGTVLRVPQRTVEDNAVLEVYAESEDVGVGLVMVHRYRISAAARTAQYLGSRIGEPWQEDDGQISED